ncbi:hypothetical protein ACJJTC_013451 [Scirpophaga incertulas]
MPFKAPCKTYLSYLGNQIFTIKGQEIPILYKGREGQKGQKGLWRTKRRRKKSTTLPCVPRPTFVERPNCRHGAVRLYCADEDTGHWVSEQMSDYVDGSTRFIVTKPRDKPKLITCKLLLPHIEHVVSRIYSRLRGRDTKDFGAQAAVSLLVGDDFCEDLRRQVLEQFDVECLQLNLARKPS